MVTETLLVANENVDTAVHRNVFDLVVVVTTSFKFGDSADTGKVRADTCIDMCIAIAQRRRLAMVPRHHHNGPVETSSPAGIYTSHNMPSAMPIYRVVGLVPWSS